MHEHLWAGVELKVGHAEFYLEQMTRAIQQPNLTGAYAAFAASGAMVGTNWQRAFYAHLDAFLAMTRSIPAVIRTCFGKDTPNHEMREWFRALGHSEQQRRQEFSQRLGPLTKEFSDHLLSTARNISLHRTGAPPVQVEITGRFGVSHVGSPVKRVPSGESPHILAGDDPGKQFAATLPPTPVQPSEGDFTIDGHPLFPECRAYLNEARNIEKQARAIASSVHGTASLTPPPVR